MFYVPALQIERQYYEKVAHPFNRCDHACHFPVIVRIVDATVQRDGDVGMLLLLVNGMIALISYRLYKKK